MSVMTGTNNGWRRIAEPGNVFTNRKWVLTGLPAGTYEWTVQAIDANFVGGSFASVKTFTIATTDISEIISDIRIGTSKDEILIYNKSGNLIDITIYSVSGFLLKQLVVTGQASIPMKQGIYIIKATDGTTVMVKKIVI